MDIFKAISCIIQTKATYKSTITKSQSQKQTHGRQRVLQEPPSWKILEPNKNGHGRHRGLLPYENNG